MLSLAEHRGQVYTGGARGLGRWLCGGVQHQRPHFLHQRQEHPAADSRGPRGQRQRVRGTMRSFYPEETLTVKLRVWSGGGALAWMRLRDPCAEAIQHFAHIWSGTISTEKD